METLAAIVIAIVVVGLVLGVIFGALGLVVLILYRTG